MNRDSGFFGKIAQHKLAIMTEAVLALTIMFFFNSETDVNYALFVSFGLALLPLGLLELYNTIASLINISKKSGAHNFWHSLLGFLAASSAVFPIALTIGFHFADWNPLLFSMATGFLALKGIEHVIFEAATGIGSFGGLFIKNALLKVLGFLALAFAIHGMGPSFLANGLMTAQFTLFFLSGVCYALDTLYKIFQSKRPA